MKNNIEYKKEDNGNHFYKKLPDGTYLHVSIFNHDGVSEYETDKFIVSSKHSKGDCCINNLPSSHITHFLGLTDSTQEEFEQKLNEAIFELGIYTSKQPFSLYQGENF